jgi:hypothetical protein
MSITTEPVVAEDAPIGILLWPVNRPEAEPNFTLMEVRIVRRATRSHVTWIYENGSERHFDLGEQVWVREGVAAEAKARADEEAYDMPLTGQDI